MEKIVSYSVVIPVYNGEKYIDGCLKSIFNQKSGDFIYEIIMVIDPSEDNSLKIAKKYEKNYENVKIIKKEEKGVSLSRYIGVKNSKNDYILFIDVDDEFVLDAFDTFTKIIQKNDVDIVNSSFYFCDVEKNNKITKNIFVKKAKYNNKQALKVLFLDASFRSYVWGKAIKRELFLKSPLLILLDKEILFEDTALMASLITHSSKIVSIKKETYIYRINIPTSATGSKRIDRLDRHIISFGLIRHYLDNYYKEFLPQFISTLFRTKMSFMYDAKMDEKNGGEKYRLGAKKINKYIKLFKNKNPLKSNGELWEKYIKNSIQ